MITIQQAEEKYRLALINIWKLSFPDDTDDFVDFYFDKIYKNEETMILIENNIPAASLQIIPYSLKLGKNIVDAGYISGAMTHPDFRRKGYMEQLLNAAFEEMQKKEYAFSFLIPQEESLIDYYAKFGYRQGFAVHAPIIRFFENDKYENVDGVSIYTQLNQIDLDTVYSIYSSFMKQKENVVLKSREQLDIFLQDFFLDDGVLFFNNKGIVLAMPEEEKTATLKEFFYENEQVQQQFLNEVFHYFSIGKITIINPETMPVSHFSGMIKTFDNRISPPDDIYMSMMFD